MGTDVSSHFDIRGSPGIYGDCRGCGSRRASLILSSDLAVRDFPDRGIGRGRNVR